MAFKQRPLPLSSPHPPPMWAFKKWDEGALWGAGGKESFYCLLHSCPSKGGLVWGNPRAEIQDLYSSVDTVSGACTIGSTVGPRPGSLLLCWAPLHGADDVMVQQAGRLMTADSWSALWASSDSLPPRPSKLSASPPHLINHPCAPLSAPQPSVHLAPVFSLNPHCHPSKISTLLFFEVMLCRMAVPLRWMV